MRVDFTCKQVEVKPDAQEEKTFWTGIMGQEEHSKDSTQLREIKKHMNKKDKRMSTDFTDLESHLTRLGSRVLD